MKHIIAKYNSIQEIGLKKFEKESYTIIEGSNDIDNVDAIVCRSAKLHNVSFGKNLKIIARAGAGVNTIPVEKCTQQGIVVCNTPGANSNAVKELVIATMIITSRNIHKGLAWTHSLSYHPNNSISTLIEKEKSKFTGNEIQGKTLGVLGLGYIGRKVANNAACLHMNVLGYDPYLPKDNTPPLSHSIQNISSIEEILKRSDYISIHVPYTEKTHHLINEALLKHCKPTAILLNFARKELVDNCAVLAALSQEKLRLFATDFPDNDTLKNPKVLNIPHLGASTKESEQNCSSMACSQIKEYLKYGNIANSVNYPQCSLEVHSDTHHRVTIGGYNTTNSVSTITSLLESSGITIKDMVNKHKENISYTVVDVDTMPNDTTLEKLRIIESIHFVRYISLTK